MILTGPAIRAASAAFLQGPAVTELLADLTHAGTDAAWARQATSTSSIIDMVLGDGVVSARLELPDGTRRHDRVEGYALLIIHVEPRGADGQAAPPASPSSWRQRFERAMQLPCAFAGLLSGELGLATSGEAPAQAGIRLEAPNDLTGLVDIRGLATLPGAQRLTESGQPPRHACPACAREILPDRWTWRALLPVTGRCPSCRARIGPYPLLAELAAGLALAVVAARVLCVGAGS